MTAAADGTESDIVTVALLHTETARLPAVQSQSGTYPMSDNAISDKNLPGVISPYFFPCLPLSFGFMHTVVRHVQHPRKAVTDHYCTIYRIIRCYCTDRPQSVILLT